MEPTCSAQDPARAICDSIAPRTSGHAHETARPVRLKQRTSPTYSRAEASLLAGSPVASRISDPSARASRLVVGFLIACVIVLPTVYVVDDAITLTRVAILLSSLAALYNVRHLLRNGLTTYGLFGFRLTIYGIIMSSVLLLIDLLNNSAIYSVKEYASRLLYILVIPVGLCLPTGFWWRVRIALVFGLIPIGLGIVQVFNPSVNIQTLTPRVPLLETTSAVDATEYVTRIGRVVGSHDISIGFALLLGFLVILGFSAWRRGLGLRWLAPAVLAGLLTPYTGTRSLVFGLLPSMLLGAAIASRRKLLAVLGSLFALTAVGLLALTLVPHLLPSGSRLATIKDNNTIVKLYSNVFTVEYVLEESPLIGIPRSDHEKAVLAKYRDYVLPISIEPIYLVTNHNQFAYFLRFYGIIGLALIGVFVCASFRLVIRVPDFWARFAVASMLVFSLQFSLLHNTFIYGAPLLWVIATGWHTDRSQPVPEYLRPCATLQKPSSPVRQ